MISEILTLQAVAAPFVCAVLCIYLKRQGIGGDFLLMWAIGFLLISITIGTAGVTQAPDNNREIRLGWTILTMAVTGSCFLFLFGTLNLNGGAVTVRQCFMWTLLGCCLFQVVQYASLDLLRFGAIAFTAVVMIGIAGLFFFTSRSIFYILAGVISLMRAGNSIAYIVMVYDEGIEVVLPAMTGTVTVFVNLAMGLCLLLLTFDNARKKLNEAQALTDSLYRENESIVKALDSSQERIFIESPDGRIRYVNQVVADIWGAGSKQRLIGKPFAEAFPSLVGQREQVIQQILAAFKAGHSWQGEIEVTRPDGSVAHNEIRVMRLPDGGILYTAKDITDERMREQREQQLKNQLIEAQKMESMGRLAGGVAHDFNNIVAAMRAFAGLIADAGSMDRAASYAARIIESCDRAAELVRQILMFSRASSADLQPLRITDVVKEAGGYLRASLPQYIMLKIESPRANVTVHGNSSQLIQVFMNLCVNARDAIGASPGQIHVYSQESTLTAKDVLLFKPGLAMSKNERDGAVNVHQYVLGVPVPDQAYVCITVRDSGPGMSGVTMERMFEPFFTTKEKARGTGLGLAVVAAVVTAHSGFIVVDSKQGHGCRFRVFLPMTSDEIAKRSAQLRSMTELSGHERVMLVDDEIDLADATTLLLAKYGYEAAPLYSPADALEIFKEDPNAWDVLVSDQVMPDMTGLELIAEVKKLRPDIKAILCTGFSDVATEKNAKALGADAFFNKPVLPEDLALAIRNLCRADDSSQPTKLPMA